MRPEEIEDHFLHALECERIMLHSYNVSSVCYHGLNECRSRLHFLCNGYWPCSTTRKVDHYATSMFLRAKFILIVLQYLRTLHRSQQRDQFERAQTSSHCHGRVQRTFT